MPLINSPYNHMPPINSPYNHVFGAMSQYDGLRIASAIRGGYWHSALMWLKESTGWLNDRSKSFLDRYKDWARLDGQIIASEWFIKENYIDGKLYPEFITEDEMEIC